MESSHLEDLGLDEKIILKWIFRNRLAQGWDRWRAIVSAVWTFGVHKMRENSLLSEDLLASQEEICSK